MKNKIIKRSPSMKLELLTILAALCISACTEPPRSDKQSALSDSLKNAATALPTKTVEKSQPMNSVRTIQKAYTDITTKLEGGDLDSTAFKYSCRGEKNGTVSYFTENGKLRLIVHRYNEYDHYSAIDRYYVRDSVIFFAHTQTVTWAFESGPEGSTKDDVKEKRIYLSGGQPFKCLEKKFVIHSKATDNPRAESVPNREVDCPLAETVMKPYRLLVKFRAKPTSDCLE